MPIQCFLSPYVKHLLVHLYDKARNLPDPQMLENFTDQELMTYFQKTASVALKDNTLQSALDFEAAVKNLCPLLLQVSTKSYTNEETAAMAKMISEWLFCVSAKDVVRWFGAPNDEYLLENTLYLLQMTAGMEWALGNVFLLEGTKCPFLLRDLIMSNELKEIFGETIMKVLCVLLGGPMSLNLRNLSWHGFVDVSDVCTMYISALRFMVFYLTTFCHNQKLLEKIYPRPQIKKHTEIKLIHERFGLLSVKENIDQIKLLFETSSIIVHSRKSLFRFALQLFESKRYGDCVVVLLPQIEHILRCRYALCNGCPGRMMTAESTEFYTTLDHVVLPTTSDGGVNRMEEEIGGSNLIMIMDLFTLHDGLRLRDHLSHGEMNSRDVDDVIASVVLVLCVLVSHHHYDTKTQKTSEVNRPPSECDATCACHQSTFYRDLLGFSSNYEALFHSLSFVKRDLKLCLDTLPRISDVRDLHEHLFGGFYKTSREIELISKLNAITSQYCSLEGANDSCIDDIDSRITFLLEKNIRTLYRNESCDVTMRQISCCMRKISINISNHLHQRTHLCESKMLRSRQRRNFQKFLLCCPSYHVALKSLVCIFLIMIHNSRKTLKVTDRKLKSILQICENSVTFTSSDVNKWDNFFEHIIKLCELLTFQR